MQARLRRRCFPRTKISSARCPRVGLSSKQRHRDDAEPLLRLVNLVSIRDLSRGEAELNPPNRE